jgi:MFS family permease
MGSSSSSVVSRASAPAPVPGRAGRDRRPVTPQERGKYQGLFGAVFIAFVVGPLVGVPDRNVGWHWIFYVNIPIGIVSLRDPAAAPTVKNPPRRATDLIGGDLHGRDGVPAV